MIDVLIVIGLIAASGMFSGLTIGLMSLSQDDVERYADLGDKNARLVLPIIKRGNQMLVTLLLGNTAVNSALSIFLGSVMSEGVIAGIVSTALILLFGEILPAAFLTRHALYVGGKVAGLVRLLMFLFAPIALPISLMLDKILGEELPSMMTRHELLHVIEKHHASEESDIDKLDRDLILGALTLQDKTAESIMTPLENVTSVDIEDVMDQAKIDELKATGFTRFPVVWDDRVVGILNIKRLIGMAAENKPAEDYMADNKFTHIRHDAKADDTLYKMIKGKAHIGVVTDHEGWIGILTMEDILEELVGQDITDEFGH